jgi:hypothetical protein
MFRVSSMVLSTSKRPDLSKASCPSKVKLGKVFLNCVSFVRQGCAKAGNGHKVDRGGQHRQGRRVPVRRGGGEHVPGVRPSYDCVRWLLLQVAEITVFL